MTCCMDQGSTARRAVRFLGAMAALSVAVHAASAAAQILVVNQDAADGTFTIEPHVPVAQSFTATWIEPLVSIQPYVRVSNPQFSRNPLEMELYVGSGLGGTSLGTRSADGGPGFDGYLPFDWSGVTLAPGQIYTFEIRDQNPYWAWSSVGQNLYSGGERMLLGTFLANEDWRFQITALPEPGSALLLLIAVVGVGVRRRY